MNKLTSVILATAAVLAFANVDFAQSKAQATATIEVHESIRNDTSKPLKPVQLPRAPLKLRQADRPRLNPNRLMGAFLFAPGLVDTAIQSKPGPDVQISIKASAYALGIRDPADHRTLNVPPEVVPPDTNGVVGDTQYVQTVNTSFAVFDKKDLTKVAYGPVPINSLWKGFGGGCEQENDGDPLVQYDKIANRWIISQFRIRGGYSQCIAVSTSSDATGAYHRYEFSEPSMNDYPKMGVWPDAYYFTYNMFGDPEGARICAYERDKMLSGQKAREVAVQLTSNYFSLLPADFDGVPDAKHLPSDGSPCFFVSLGTAADTLDLWKFKVNWASPTESTFGGDSHKPDATIQVAHFVDAASTDSGTVPQLGTPQKLDTLGDRLLYRLAYRKFDDHESLVVSHCVKSTAVAAVRWYELRDPNGQPTVFQQGTFSPDSTCRWVGSLAMDKFGNLAVGYSASSSAEHPSIRVAVQKANPDTSSRGILSTEHVLRKSANSQGDAVRWGDYSCMSVDPADDTTFYFTTEYLPDSAKSDWGTRVVAFTIGGNTTATP